MTTITRPTPTPGDLRTHERKRASLWAWVGVLLTPVTFILGFVVAFTLANLLEVDLFTWDQMTLAEYAVAMVPATVVWLSAPLLAVVMGLRAIARGSRWAYAAVGVGAAVAVYVIYEFIASLMHLAG